MVLKKHYLKIAICSISCSKVKSTNGSDCGTNGSSEGASLGVVAVESVFETCSVGNGNILQGGVNTNSLITGG